MSEVKIRYVCQKCGEAFTKQGILDHLTDWRRPEGCPDGRLINMKVVG